MSRRQFRALRIEDLKLRVRLGYTATERARPQEVRVSAEFRFLSPPGSEKSDLLRETICYATLAEALRAHCESRPFKLVERLGAECLAIARGLAGRRAEVAVAVHKVRPPVKGLKGGTFYRCGDFLP
jgi:FolB domain-containing protein